MPAYASVVSASLVLMTLVGCSESKQVVDKTSGRVTALREWKRHESIVAEAIDGKYREDQILKSLIFFQELTGITVRGDGTAIGYILDERAGEDLVRLQEWCDMHCDEIYWDEASQKVRRLPDPD